MAMVTAADVVHGTYGSRGLELAVAITGMVATMPYIALQLIGMGVVNQGDGLDRDLPIVAAFIILALYTYSSGLRAPALIAFVKDIMIYIVVLVAVVVVPAKLGGYGAVFAAANDAFEARAALPPDFTTRQCWLTATLALGSALAASMYPKASLAAGEHGAVTAELCGHHHDRHQHHDINHDVLDEGDQRRRAQPGTVGVERQDDEGGDDRQITGQAHRLDHHAHPDQLQRDIGMVATMPVIATANSRPREP